MTTQTPSLTLTLRNPYQPIHGKVNDMAAYIICQKRENKRNNAGNKCDATVLKIMSRTEDRQLLSFGS
jgi:hypothetical protein